MIFLLIPLALVLAGVVVVLMKNRGLSSDSANVDSFRRELDALAPSDQEQRHAGSGG